MLRSIIVRDYMAANLVTFSPDTDVMQALHRLVAQRISGAPVVDERGNLVGMLSERDCLRVALQATYHEESAGKVKDYMSTGVTTVEADTTILEVAEMFLSAPYRRYPVVEDIRLVGQISRRDVLRALQSVARAGKP